ncbi:hypothetical protein H8356DRAFT_1023075 [Neocallimastix lanati (nom. inval.)]|uniref:PIN-like domain-containing protein n=1 Tax=Neocallimastix californiae TaxID=1754190 RepID=A0A1Y2BYC2_9FUNG|nr:hypothetical protein H8356DRAFT_1023075 [Neocallimastix sp. JGI-2020a]ORY39770.1 hypothetical protein LY90DRAFT_510560 [Neocallimastix californiae]|eukprot:ORY39770.1 hypothetical protein LY90DRAFT_510560 [Neocallimastix californiae]
MVKSNFYLIDYENVNKGGLYGSEELSSNDSIIIFTSQQHQFNNYEYLNTLNYKIIEVPPGNQSVDKNLIFYLGYLIGQFKCNTSNYIIISKDKGYDKIVNFWKKEIYNITIQRFPSISSSFFNQSDEEELFIDIRRVLINICDISTSNDVVSIVSKYYGSKHILSLIHNNLQKIYSYPTHRDIYMIIKSVIKRHQSNSSNNNSQNNNNNKNINNIIQRILSNKGFIAPYVNGTASIVSKNYLKKNGKEIIYQRLVSEYGFENGLNIYNYIKGNI